jgi:putative membrane protein
MRRLLAKGVPLLWAWILAGLLLPAGNGPPALHSFLRPDLWWLVAAGALISVLFFLVSITRDRHTHSHVKSRMGAVIKPLLLLAPASFILAFGKAEYGADGLAGRLTMKRAQQAGYSKLKAAEAPQAAAPGSVANVPVYRADLLQILNEPESFTGRRVKTTGMLHEGRQIPENHLYLFRYVMVCCAADAIPVGVFIEKADSVAVKENAWYEIEGVVRPDSLDGCFVVKLDEAVMRPVSKPKTTWLYPR